MAKTSTGNNIGTGLQNTTSWILSNFNMHAQRLNLLARQLSRNDESRLILRRGSRR